MEQVGEVNDRRVSKAHHQVTENGQDYSLFHVHCGKCDVLLFEFVHKLAQSTYSDKLWAISPRNPSMGASSWYKPAVRVVCEDGEHRFVSATAGEDRNQVVRSRAMNCTQFEEWMGY